MRYISNTPAQQKEMLARIGAASVEALLANVPAKAPLSPPLPPPAAPGRGGPRGRGGPPPQRPRQGAALPAARPARRDGRGRPRPSSAAHVRQERLRRRLRLLPGRRRLRP